MNMIRRSVLGVTAVTLVAASTLAWAQPHGGQRDGGMARLNLSSSQKAQIEKIRNQYRSPETAQDQKSQHEAQMQQHRAQMNALLQSKTFDEPKARNLIAQQQQWHAAQQQQRAESQLNRMKTQHAIFQVLTPAQQKQWLEQRQNQKPMRGMHKGQRQDMPMQGEPS